MYCTVMAGLKVKQRHDTMLKIKVSLHIFMDVGRTEADANY